MKNNKYLVLVVLLLATLNFAQAQSSLKIGNNSTIINTSAVLELQSTTKGFLLPRMTNVQKNAILSPEVGLVVWCSDCGITGLMQVYNGTAWTNMNGVVTSLPSSNGTAVISAITCNTASAGTMTEGLAVSGVTQTITATVTTVGSYNFSTTANGVTFSASGTFAGTGNQNIVLTASGTPTNIGSFNYSLNSTPSCSFVKFVQTEIVEITSTTGKIWMDRNLGATRVAQSSVDYMAYGSLYQWGRGSDGHELINWTSATVGTPVNGTTATLSTTDYPADNLFIIQTASPYDWRATQNDNLWQGVAGVNNPCPAGYRLPTDTELTAEVTAYSITNSAGAFASPLKFTVPGSRDIANGTLSSVGSFGTYWSSSVSGTTAILRFFNAGGTNTYISYRASGFTVRCIKD